LVWFEGTFLSLVNPKAYAAMAALFSGFILVAGDPVAIDLALWGVFWKPWEPSSSRPWR
jgi:threonine/homoserine/homoserine lactone efflux protein